VGPLEPFTFEEASEILRLIDGLGNSLDCEVAVQQLPSAEELDLETLVTEDLGITDPIGQLAKFIQDQLNSVASWIVSRVEDALKWAFDTFIKPALDALHRLVEDAYKGLTDSLDFALSAVRSWVSELGTSVTSALTSIAERLWGGIKQLMDAVSSVADRISSAIQELATRVKDALAPVVSQLWSWVQTALARLSTTIQGIVGRVWEGIQWLSTQVTNALQRVWEGIQSITSYITQAVQTLWSWVQTGLSQVVSTVQGIASQVWSALTTIGQTVSSLITQLWERIQTGLAQITSIVQGIATQVWDALTTIGQVVTTAVSQLQSWIQQIPQWVMSGIQQLWSWIQTGLAQLSSMMQGMVSRIWEGIQWIGSQVATIASQVWSAIQSVGTWVQSAIRTLWSWIQTGLSQIVNAVSGIADRLWGGIQSLATAIQGIPQVIQTYVQSLATQIWGGIQWLGTQVTEMIGRVVNAFTELTKHIEVLSQYVTRLGTIVTGGFNALARLPEAFWGLIPDWLRNAITSAQQFFTTIADYVTHPEKLLEAVWGGLQRFLQAVWAGIQWVGARLVDAGKLLLSIAGDVVRTTWGTIVKLAQALAQAISSSIRAVVDTLFFEPLGGVGPKLASSWFTIISRPYGELQLLFEVARSFLWEYYWATLMVYAFTGIAEGLSDLEVWIEPEVMGSQLGGARFRISFRQMVEALVKAIKEFYPNFLLGSMFGLASTILRPIEYVYRAKFVRTYDGRATQIFADVLAEEIRSGATISMFVEPPTITELKDWLRRTVAVKGGLPVREGKVPEIPKELIPSMATFRAHLKLRGLPKWFIDYMTDMGQKLVVTFVDRFGVTRGVWLGEVFELPTHSELARMTQRDIFPSIYEMQKVAWTRGWNPDLTKMIYLLTFKYPSFEKLWRFYMRATAGMLWFSPPEGIKEVFNKEAQALGAGKPVPPLEVQRRIRGPDQFRAFELALNTYFKWLEYSNFSWFTPQTQLYGVPIGRIIHDALGGWPADSWIMADVASDIPGKIDLRWMSRFGIFLWLASRGEAVGLTFESYTPLVEAIPRVLEDRAVSPITVDLRWFSKLLQATGLHPAWVPITTVAENIMVIADEMTLLRTGWLHLFKEGMLRVEDVEKYLSGIITVSYRVGYWDPSTKQWTSRWVNLPVRWLPHERRLLELRMLMDRVYDVYREVYSFIRSGIRALAIRPEDAIKRVEELIKLLDTHYSRLAREVTGKEMHIELDKSYAELWVKAESLAIDIEAITRVRYWWFRVAGWLLYRISYGYVTIEDVENLIASLESVIPIHPIEKKAYIEIAKTILGIVRREYIPTPSQLATLAEYLVIPKDLVEEALKARNVPKEWWGIWETYIAVRPLKPDYKSLLSAYIRALRYGAVGRDVFEAFLARLRTKGFTDEEIEVIRERVDIELLIEEVREVRRAYLPTPTMLATLSEYLVLPKELILRTLQARGVPAEWVDIWLKYIEVRPIKPDYKSLLSVYIRAYIYGAIDRSRLDKFIELLKTKGFTPEEISIIRERVELEEAIAEARELRRAYLPTPSQLATLAEYVTIPSELIEEVFRARRVPIEWAKLWLRYVEVRPLADEARLLATTYFRAVRYGVQLGRLKDEVEGILRSLGFTEAELRLRRLRATIEAMIDEWREARELYVPTPTMLATLAEYVSIPPDLIKEALEARHVPKEWMGIWLKYVEVRPLANEVRRLATAFFRLKRYAMIYGVSIKDVESKVVPILKNYGYTDKELSILELASRVEVAIEEVREMAREWVPTISMLATLSEWVKIPQQLINEVLEKRRIPQSWRPFWLNYLRIAPFRDDFRAFLTEYFYMRVWNFREPEIDRLASELMRVFNFEELERRVFEARARMRRVRYAWAEMRYWIRASLRNLAYGVARGRISESRVEEFFRMLKDMGFTDEEISAMRLYYRTYVVSHMRS